MENYVEVAIRKNLYTYTLTKKKKKKIIKHPLEMRAGKIKNYNFRFVVVLFLSFIINEIHIKGKLLGEKKKYARS